MKLVKKLTAYLVVLSMIFGMTSAYAVGTPIKTDEYSDQRGDLSYIFLGTSPANQDVAGRYGSSYTGNLDGLTKDFEWEKDGLVWIGIQVKNMSRLRGMFNSDVTTSNATSGLGSFSLSLAYDTDYFTLPSNTGNYGAAQSATQLTNYPVSYQGSKALYDFSEETGITYQEMKEASASASIRDLTLSQTDDSKVGIYKASAKTNTTNMQPDDCLLFQDGADPTYGWDGMTPNPVTDDPFTMFVIPLKMVGDTAPAAGTKAIEGYFDMAVSTMIVGTDGTNFITYAYDTRRDEGGTNGDTNLNNYFNITSLVDLFPVSYSVNFYEDSTCNTLMTSKIGTVLGATGIAEGTAIADAGIKVPVDGTDFDKVNGDGEYFSKFYYVDATGTEQEFDKLATIGAAAAVDSGTEIKVYPKYLPGHTVTFNSEYPANSGLSDKTVNKTVAPTSPGALSKTDAPTVGTSGEDFQIPTGYAFGGWYTGKNGSGDKVVFEETGVTGTDLSGISNVYANWVSQYKVEFVIDKDGTGSDNVVQTLYVDPAAEDKTVAKPETDPTKTGYNFKGWYYDNGGVETAFVSKGEPGATKINADIKVYAKWAKLVTVKYYDTKDNATAGTSTGLTDSEEVEEGTKYTDLTKIPSRSDNDTTKKYFDGWYNVAGDTKVDFTSTTATVTSDLTVYEKWGDYYKLDFYKEKEDITGGEGIYTTEYVNPKVATKLAILPNEPTKANYGFNEWRVYDSATSTVTSTKFDTNTTLSGDMKLVANWTEKVKISFYPNDGTGTDGLGTVNEVYVTPNVTFDGTAPADPTRANYDFAGWNTASNGTGTKYADQNAIKAATFTSATTLYAQWTPKADQTTATLTFDSTGGTAVTPASITVVAGDKIYASQMPADPTKTSATNKPYTFDGWYEEATLTNTSKFTTPITLNADDTAYAHWKYEQDDAITISFNDDGATTKVSPTSIQIAPGDSIGDAWPTDPEKTGNTFGGWYTDVSVESTKKDKNSIFNDTTQLNAKWIADITIEYKDNDGTGGPGTVTKPAATTYEDPTTLPTRAGYTFIGWNTNQNGSGTYVKAANVATYAAVSALFDGSPSTVQLYAQWAAVPDTPNDKGKVETDTPTDPDPAKQGVKVTFDSNALGSASQAGIKDASPKYKYPQYGDTIGTDNMPEKPERPNYEFKGWNTKADGSGVSVDGTTAIGTNLGDAIKAIENTTTAYEVTLYAQWQVAPDYLGDKVTVTFNKNTDGKGTDAAPTSIEIVKGDSLGYLPTDPTNGDFSFDGWFTGSANANGKIEFTGNKLTATTPINDTTTYYAQWSMYLMAELKTPAEATYTGKEIEPEYEIWQIDKPVTGQAYNKIKTVYTGKLSDPTSQFTATYTLNGTDSTIKNVGTYAVKSVALKADSELYAKGAKIAVEPANDFEVKAVALNIKLDPDKQKQKVKNVTLPTVDDLTVETLVDGEIAGNILGIKYYKWTDATAEGASAPDGQIQDSELVQEAAPSAVGKYVMKIEFNDNPANYVIDSVESSVTGKTVITYPKTADSSGYAVYADGKVGQNLVFEILANDPSISGITVKSADTKDKDGNPVTPEVVKDLSLKKNDYTTDETFDNKETPDITAYYIRVTDVDADEARFTVTLTNPDTTTLTATGGTAVKNADGTYTVTAPLTSKGATPNVVEITTKAGTETDAPTITYTFNVQQLVEAKIEMEPGNSPYGLIERMGSLTLNPWDKTVIQQAKDAFRDSDVTNKTYGAGLVPEKGNTNLIYTSSAWGSYTDDSGTIINYDLNPNALFVYQSQQFKLPSIKAYDDLGNEIQSVKKTFKIKKQNYEGVSRYTGNDSNDNVTEIDAPLVNGTDDTYDLSGIVVRNDVYSIEYEYSYTDATGVQKTLKDSRPIIILSKIGDLYLTGTVVINDADSTHLKKNTTSVYRGNSLVAYRSADLVTGGTAVINDADATYLKKNTTLVYRSTNQYYPSLD